MYWKASCRDHPYSRGHLGLELVFLLIFWDNVSYAGLWMHIFRDNVLDVDTNRGPMFFHFWMLFYYEILHTLKTVADLKENISCFEKNVIFLGKSAKVMRYVCICSELSVKLFFYHQNWAYILFLVLVRSTRGCLRSYDTQNLKFGSKSV